MSADETTRDTVLRVLAGQSPDYFAFPNASAFVAEGLDPGEVADVLAELHDDGTLERELILIPADADADGEGEQVPGGYRISRGGVDMSETPTEPTEPTEPVPGPTDPEPTDGDEDDDDEGK